MTLLPTRRRFLLFLTAIPAGAMAPAGASETRVEEGEADAKNFGYRERAAAVDPKAEAKFKPGQNCANCSQYDGAPGQPYGSCALFLGREVAAGGWCNAWEAKAATPAGK
jgi:hypothetical protein